MTIARAGRWLLFGGILAIGILAIGVVGALWFAGPDCTSSPHARDMCRYDEAIALPLTEAAAARARVAQIEDPVVRSAAVQVWMRRNPQVSPEAGLPLCDLLDATEAGFCRRRVTAPHLHGH